MGPNEGSVTSKGELYSNSSNYVVWNQYGNGEVASLGVQLPVSTVLHGQSTVSNIGDISLENISGPAETLQIEGSWRF